MQKPPKWAEVYPQGTKEGNEEQKFFKVLARHPTYVWRSAAAIAKESGLPRKRVEEILKKYVKLGMVFNSPKNEDNWGYWERVPEMLNSDPRSIADRDQDKRIKDASSVIYNNSAFTASPNCLSGQYHVMMDGVLTQFDKIVHATEYVYSSNWDFDFEIGDKIKAKYAEHFVNIVEVLR